MNKYIVQLDAILEHLNASENAMALEFRENLKRKLESADRDALYRQCLEAGGVDNWTWYGESLHDGGYWDDEEDEDDE